MAIPLRASPLYRARVRAAVRAKVRARGED